MPLIVHSTDLTGVSWVETGYRADERGSFARLFCTTELAGLVGRRSIVQINHSKTSRVGAVRGLHYQLPPHAEMKLVRCIRGKVWDVAVDLRAGSATLLRWLAVELSADNGRMLAIPEGCAHGFQVLEPNSELLYLHTNEYAPQHEGGLSPLESRLSIQWPLSVVDLSERDQTHPALPENYTGIELQ